MLNDFGESKVTVKKAELLASMRANLSKHREVFLAATDGYRKAVIDALDKCLREAREGAPFVLWNITSLVVPQDHTKDYERVIRMLEMSVADEISVTEQQFSQFVLDDWGWKAAFVASTSRYTG